MQPAFMPQWASIAEGLAASAGVAAAFTALLLAKSMRDYSRTGPKLQQEVQEHYRAYLAFAIVQLGFWAYLIALVLASAGALAYGLAALVFGLPTGLPAFAAASACGLVGLLALRFAHVFVWTPALLAISSHYQIGRIARMWHRFSVLGVDIAESLTAIGAAMLAAAAAWSLASQAQWAALCALIVLAAALPACLWWFFAEREPAAVRSRRSAGAPPNILMIGSDTLRADRLGAAGYRRELTPHLDELAARGTQFTQCYVPCARTAPSLLSLLTGCWPQQHGIRDNFADDEESARPLAALPRLLREAGYATAVVGDWAASDMKKFDLGFEQADVPDDQWNLKYLLRQGPKDLRLFLSMFARNRLGKALLPEIYYLAGVPLTRQVGRDARALLGEFTARDRPFFLNVFMASTHPPFGSDLPYYSMFADPAYTGESKFAMARLTDPFEIIRRQGDGRKEFDLDQIIDLYDGCVKSFDDELARLLRHLDRCGLRDNTIVVVYSDHGMEFFEQDTWGQGNSVKSDVSACIPLVVVDPRLDGGHLCPHTTRSIDLAPTLLDRVGLPVPAAMQGVSLRPWMEGARADTQLIAYNETGLWLTQLPGMPEGHLRYPDLFELLEVRDKASGTLGLKQHYRPVVIEAKDRMLRQGRWKLVYQPLRGGALCQLFDVETDPECRRDLSAEHPEVFDTLRRMMNDWVLRDGGSPILRGKDERPALTPTLALPHQGGGDLCR